MSGRLPEGTPPGGASAGARTRVRVWAPSLAISATAGVVMWLNRSPWWGWLVVAALVVAIAGTTRWWLRGRALVRVGAWLLAAALVAGAGLAAAPVPQVRIAGGSDPQPAETVVTREGPVQGVTNDDRSVEIFAGVPYAQPPVGHLRWRPPAPPAPRSALLVADRFSPAPVQPTSTFATRALSQVVRMPLEDTLLNPYPVSEDSLTLNIWRSTRPADEPLPVLVYIPGGGFATGSGALPLYDGEALASRGDVLTVTLNYRLGVLGFLAHPELSAESGHDASGNYGLLDQIAALEWIRDNIASFGGDPDRVTIAGESAGGESVCLLGATPLAAGLVDGIIAGSGACMGTTGDTEDGDQADTREVAEEAGRRLSAALGGASLDELRDMPVDRVVEAAASLGSHWRPSVDGRLLERSPADVYAAGEQLDVPILVGSNADEASLALAAPPRIGVDEYRTSAHELYGTDAERFLRLYPADTAEEAIDATLQAQTDRVMTRAMQRWAQLQTGGGRAEAFLYFFSHVPPQDGLERYGAYHGAEVAYAYDNLAAVGDVDHTDADLRLRDRMSGHWVRFARTGDPNGPGLPEWPSVDEAPGRVMEFGGDGGMAPRPRPDAVDFWLRYDGPIA